MISDVHEEHSSKIPVSVDPATDGDLVSHLAICYISTAMTPAGPCHLLVSLLLQTISRRSWRRYLCRTFYLGSNAIDYAA